MDAFLSWLESEKKYSCHTVVSYRNDLKGFQDFLETRYGSDVLELSGKPEIKTWIMELLNAGKSPATVNRKLAALSGFFNYSIKEGLVNGNPVESVSRPKKGRRLAQFIDETTTKKVFADDQFENDFTGTRAKLLMELLYTTGIRVSELIGILHGSIDVSRREMKVLGKGNKERVIPIGKRIVILVKELSEQKMQLGFSVQSSDELLVTDKGKGLYPMFVSRTVKEVLQQHANITGTNPHILRHTFATHLLNNGSDITSIKDLMGHASLASTTVYTHNTIDRLKEVHKEAHPRK